MKTKERVFRFKQFNVMHSRSAMKVGVDGVLLGAWTSCRSKRVLDVGCGCGLIALMIAQRFSDVTIDAIDVDVPSVEEACANVEASHWHDRISVSLNDFVAFAKNPENTKRYGLIVSNPPFFDSGVAEPLTPRERSRHQGSLSPVVLIEAAPHLLENGGLLSLIAPADMAGKLEEAAKNAGLSIVRTCLVRNSIKSPWKRVMMEFGLNLEGDEKIDATREELTMFEDSDMPTAEYRAIGCPFYLKF